MSTSVLQASTAPNVVQETRIPSPTKKVTSVAAQPVPVVPAAAPAAPAAVVPSAQTRIPSPTKKLPSAAVQPAPVAPAAATPMTTAAAATAPTAPSAPPSASAVAAAAAVGDSADAADHNRAFSLKDFQIGRQLGQGKFGKVYLARELRSGTQKLVAMKVLDKEKMQRYGVAHQLKKEVEIHYRMRAAKGINIKNVVRLYACFSDKKRVYLVLKYCPGGEVFKAMKATAEKRFDEPRAARYIAQLMSALRKMHKRSVIHRDIKPENLLLDERGDIMLADFGWTVNHVNEANKRETICGTLDYLAPEMVGSEAYDEAVDIWSVGVLAYEFIAGVTPFYEKEQHETTARILEATFEFPEHFTHNARDFISQLIKRDGKSRLALKHALKHPWILEHTAGAAAAAPKKA